MHAKILSISIQKGGTGKTTTSINAASWLALKGYSVLVVDLDPQANLTSAFGFPEFIEKKRNTIYEAIFYMSSDEDYNVSDIILTHNSGVDIIPSTQHLANADYELGANDDPIVKFFVLQKILDQVRRSYDIIIIDTPPALNNLTINAWTTSDYYLIPMSAEEFAVRGLVKQTETANRIKQNFNKDLELVGIVFNKFSEKIVLWRMIRKEVEKHFGAFVLDAHIRQNIALAEAQRAQQTIFQYNPKCTGAEDFEALTEVLIDKMKLPIKVH
ncbi:MAG: AAA family ATPase [Bacteroidota bacterium]